jgi:hypothetical protein
VGPGRSGAGQPAPAEKFGSQAAGQGLEQPAVQADVHGGPVQPHLDRAAGQPPSQPHLPSGHPQVPACRHGRIDLQRQHRWVGPCRVRLDGRWPGDLDRGGRRHPDAFLTKGGWQPQRQHGSRGLIEVGGVGLGQEPLGRGLPTQRLVRPSLVVVLHPGIQDLLGDLQAGQRRQGGQQLLAQRLVEPLDLAGGGRRPDPGQAVGDAVLAQDPLEQHLGWAGLPNRPVNCLPLSVSTSSGTP